MPLKGSRRQGLLLPSRASDVKLGHPRSCSDFALHVRRDDFHMAISTNDFQEKSTVDNKNIETLIEAKYASFGHKDNPVYRSSCSLIGVWNCTVQDRRNAKEQKRPINQPRYAPFPLPPPPSLRTYANSSLSSCISMRVSHQNDRP